MSNVSELLKTPSKSDEPKTLTGSSQTVRGRLLHLRFGAHGHQDRRCRGRDYVILVTGAKHAKPDIPPREAAVS